jgi:uncharacterized protein
MAEIHSFALAGLFLLALIAGTIDAMAGGCGLLTVPALLAVGLPPATALATNKSQAIFSSLSASLHFWRKGKLRLREHVIGAPAALLGGGLGAACISRLDPGFLRVLVPVLLIGIALWLAFGIKPQNGGGRARIAPALCAGAFVPLIAFYDGFFGPGTGTFFAIGLVGLIGLTLETATVHAKLYNFMSNLGALTFFLAAGHVVWEIGLCMAAGTVIGGNLGARLVLSHGARLIRPVLAAVSLTMSLHLLWRQEAVQTLLSRLLP